MLRVQLRCTQKELAEKLSVSPGAIHKYENNQMQPTLRTVAKIENYIKKNNISLEIGLDKIAEKQGELTMNQQTKLIDYQENEIQQLKKENTILKSKAREAE